MDQLLKSPRSRNLSTFAGRIGQLLIVFIILTLPLFSQQPVVIRPDCILPIGTLTLANVGQAVGPFDNRTTGCVVWVFSYTTVGFGTLSIVVQTAPTAAGEVPGAWSTFAAVTGVNPNTNIVQAISTFGNQTVVSPWVRVFLTSGTGGPGTIQGLLYGCRNPANCGVGGTVSVPQPLQVDGPTAAGSPPTTPPVLVAGQDGTNVQTIRTDTSGRQIVVGAAANGAATAGNPVLVGFFDGTNVQIPPMCTNQAFVNLSGSGNTQIVPLSGSTKIRICHIDASTTAAEDIKLTSGTGANCGTGTADLTALLKSVQSFAFDYGPFSPLVAPAAAAVCMNQSAAQPTGVTVIFAQF
jgi:hypothetical protein